MRELDFRTALVAKASPTAGVMASKPWDRYFGRMPHSITAHAGFSGLDCSRVKNLIEDSFGKTLDPEYFEKPVERVFIEADYRGIAIVKKIKSTPYLDKFAVATSMQGNGLGGAIWREMKSRYDSLIWRASPDNPINKWYFEKSTGHWKEENWTVFWYNLGRAHAFELIPIVAKLPATLTAVDVAFGER